MSFGNLYSDIFRFQANLNLFKFQIKKKRKANANLIVTACKLC